MARAVNDRPLAGRVAWVTGGATGMGRAMALAFAGAGADVAIGSLTKAVHGERVARETALDVGDELLAKTRGEIEALGVSCLALPLNVRLDESVRASHARIVGALGEVDILANAAGHGGRHPIAGHPDEFWHRTIDVDLTGAYRTIKLCLPAMVQRRWGRIVNIASTAAVMGDTGYSAYCSAKSALVGLTRCVALEAAPFGVTCNAISPGNVLSHQGMNSLRQEVEMGRITVPLDDHLAALAEDMPQKRWIQPDEIGAFALFLCGEKARGLTMENIRIAGGSLW